MAAHGSKFDAGKVSTAATKWVALLSALALTPDYALEAFRRRRLPESPLAVDQLRLARALLEFIGAALGSADPRAAQLIERLCALLPEAALAAPAERATPAIDRDAPAPNVAPTAPSVDVTSSAVPAIDCEDALPFRDGLPVAPPPAIAEPNDALGGTAFVPAVEFEEPLPFTGTRAQPPTPARSEPNDALGGTAFVPAVEFEEPLPFKPTGAQAPNHLTTMTLEQYAALCAYCAARPGAISEIHARYGIRSAGERAELDRNWRERVAADPELRRQWDWHYARYAQLYGAR